MPPPKPPAGGNILTRKIGPLPGWAWGAVGVGVYLLYRARKQAAAGSSSASTLAGTGGSVPYTEPTVSYTTPSGFQYSGPASDLGYVLGSSAAPTGAMAATGASSAPVATGASGAGYQQGPGGTFLSTFTNEAGNTVGRGPQGAFVGITDPNQAAAYSAQGTTLYSYSPTAGFAPLSANQQGTIPGEFLKLS